MRVDRASLGQLRLLSEGRSGTIFLVEESVIPDDPTPMVCKLFTSYHAEQAHSAEAADAFRDALGTAERCELDRYTAWPRAVVQDASGEVCGFLMPHISQEFLVPQADPVTGDIVHRPCSMSWLIAPDDTQKMAKIQLGSVNRTQRIVLLAQLTYIMGWLHEHGWVFGDLNLQSAVFTLDPIQIMLLNCDRTAALNDFDRKQLQTPFWDPPECQIHLSVGEQRRQELQDTITDVYKLGLAILRSLTPGKGAASTKDAGRLADTFDAEGTDLVVRALSANRGSRPTAMELYAYLYGLLPAADRTLLPNVREPRRFRRPLAGVRSDAPSAEDLIGAAADVETLADLIAASETAPPLAIALIGDWGAGKSSVMLQVQRRIDVLAEMSRNNPGLSMFAANVRQIQFNAWDYSDHEVWSGLVEHLFQALAPQSTSPLRSSDSASVETQRVNLTRQLTEREAEDERLNRELAAADSADGLKRNPEDLPSPLYAMRVIIATMRSLAGDVRGTFQLLLGWAVLGAVALGAWLLWGALTGTVTAAIAAVVSPAVLIGQRLRRWHRAGADFISSRRRQLDARQHSLRREIAELKERLALIDAATRLSTFLANRAAPNAYSGYRSLFGQIRGDLGQLSIDLKQAQDEWFAAGGSGAPPLERIVLYIDDLDRCPPHRVVEVLEAIHLMLALELFVVVVAVDARWLIRCLNHHYRELFTQTTDLIANSHELPAHEGTTSPIDFLDKIFQIPYALAPPTPAAFASYLRSLLPFPAEPGSALGSQASVGVTAEGDEHSGQIAFEQVYRQNEQPTSRREGQYHTMSLQTTAPIVAMPDLRPLGLQMTRREIEFMTRLGPMLPTPRAAKKLANLYRLVRIGIADADLAAFTGTRSGGPYQAVQILLAFLVGSPATAQRIFTVIMNESSESDILTILDKSVSEEAVEQPDCVRLRDHLAKVARDVPLLIAAKEYQFWCPILARHSFHTKTLVSTKRSEDKEPDAFSQSSAPDPEAEQGDSDYDPDFV